MRRFASVFSSSKRDKNEKTPKRTPSVTLNVRTQPLSSDITTFDSSLSTPQLSSAGGSEPANSSASSAGSVSLSLQTPEDIPTSHSKKTWIPWLAKKSGTIKAVNRSESRWTPRPPLLHNPPPVIPGDSDSESVDAYGEEDDSHPVTPATEKPIVTSASLDKARKVLETLIQNSLNDRPTSAPFVVQAGTPLYPRSCNRSRSLPSSNSLASSVHKRRMLQRLQDANLRPSEADSIITLSLRDIPKVMPVSPDILDDKAFSTSDRIALFSTGLRNWITRPPFEDRCSVWSAVDGNITRQRISNTAGFALAALEFSEAIEVQADVYGQPFSLQIAADLQVPARSASALDVPSSASSASSHVSSSASLTKSLPSPQLLAPSPLRNQTSTPSLPSPQKESTLQVSVSNKEDSPLSPSSSVEEAPSLGRGTAKRGVRFIEEDKDENIPIGYVMRIKKQREEKARFLREQKERRQYEEERAKVEEERKQRDIERRKWEQERLAWEKEKRAMEEERKRKQYAEEVVAARQRAESSRIGMRVSSSTSLRETERSKTTQSSNRLSRGSDTPPSPPRRLASDPFPRDQSSANSRPPSMNYPSSRPSSIHSSTEDIRTSRPVSTALYIPPVPPIPQLFPYQSGYPMDMPLLPPTAPFMVNQYSRRQSQSSNSSSRQHPSSNSSTESLNRHAGHGRQGSSPRDSSTSSPSSSPHRSHQRRTSDDSGRHLSMYSHPSSSPHTSSTHLPRGRPTNSARSAQTPPSPWSAPPTFHGGIPTSMPTYGAMHTVTRHTPSRRQTTFS
ncbi:hypothetical protein GYMLUDRAFT_238217 [Collybiopsis luxurians FD-317 M1]|nr:hypothetical protein GYMLUDRAFT_238217 [Collybiopsis luxurians FD-317 M1]